MIFDNILLDIIVLIISLKFEQIMIKITKLVQLVYNKNIKLYFPHKPDTYNLYELSVNN